MRGMCWLVAIVSGACGRVGFDAAMDASAIDADDVDVDADLLGEWGPPQVLTGLNSASDESDPAISDDGLELVFHSDRPGGLGGYDLYHSVRASTAEMFTTVAPLPGVNTAGDELGPTLSPDGLTVFFSDGQDIVFAVRPDLDSAFGPRQALPELSSADVDTAPALSGDGRIAIVTRGVVSTRDLWMHTRPTDGPPNAGWSAGVQLTELASAETESSPELDELGLTVHFHSDRAAGSDDDIYIATRASTAVPFEPPTTISVSSPEDEGDPSLTADRRTIVFHRMLELHIATR